MDNIAVKHVERPQTDELVCQVYSDRIKELRGYVLEDEIEVNPASEGDFWNFMDSLLSVKRAAIVFCDNGNFRAVWKDTQGGHVGIQFFRRATN